MNQVSFDSLGFYHTLVESGLADATATAISDCMRIQQEVIERNAAAQHASKGEITSLRLEFAQFKTEEQLARADLATKADIAALKADISSFKEETHAAISSLREETRAGISSLREETRADIAALREETRADIAALKMDTALLKKDVSSLREEMRLNMSLLREEMNKTLASHEGRLIRWIIGTVFGAGAAILGAIAGIVSKLSGWW